MNMSDIGRDAFIIYLKDLRDLETSKQLLSNTYNEKAQRVPQDVQQPPRGEQGR